MKKTTLLTVYCLLFTVCSSYSQVSADSLPGTYAGQFWYANPATNPWIITQDTLYVQSNIDTVNCIVQEYDVHFSGIYSLYTDYYSCNGPEPSNAYSKFYSGDSARFITDNYPQPPPQQPFSLRFYGKRISNKIITAINEFVDDQQLSIYPNPCNSILNIEYKMPNKEALIIITDIMGRVTKMQTSEEHDKSQVDVSNLREGIYFVKVQSQSGIVNEKLLMRIKG